MNESKAKWDEVGERFNDVAKRLKEHFEAHPAPGPQDEASTETTESIESSESSEKVSDALNQISAALDAGFTTIGESIRDPAMLDDLKRAGTAIADALATTFQEASEEVKKRLS